MRVNVGLLFFIACSVMMLASCGSDEDARETLDWEATTYDTVNDVNGVLMEVKEGTISSTGGTFILKNDTDTDYTYGESYVLEKRKDDDWYQVPVIIDEYGFEDIGYELGASDSAEWEVDWEVFHGELNSGEYRIVKEILEVHEPGDYDRYDVTAEFTVE